MCVREQQMMYVRGCTGDVEKYVSALLTDIRD